jgi:hypothetical protein
VGLFLLTLACGKSLERQTRDQVRSLAGAELGSDAVEVTNVRETGNQAVADLVVRTAVKLKKEDGRWTLDEVRLGDRRWERVDRIVEAIEALRRAETEEQLDRISAGIRGYREAHGSIPQVETFELLIDRLSPRFLDRVIRLDAWQSRFSYRVIDSERFELRSPGRDRTLGTDDDLVVVQ